MGDRLKTPMVSVIIPTYNRAHFVGRAIRSVLNQTYQDFELIVVDDACSDNTEEIVRGFNDDRIRYIRHDENKGGAAARNTGIKAARGEYVAFQDDDDEWMPVKLEKQLEVLRTEEKVGMVYTDMWRIDQADHGHYFRAPHIDPRDEAVFKKALYLRLTGIGVQSSLIKRECLERVGGFDERFPRWIDLELFVRLSKDCIFYHIEEPLVVYHREREGIITDRSRLIIAHKLFLEKYRDEIVADRRLLAFHMHTLGRSLVRSTEPGGFDEGRDYLLRAIGLHPWSMKYVGTAFISLFGPNVYSKVAKIRRLIVRQGWKYDRSVHRHS